MSRKPIAFRSTVRGGVEDFLEESGLTEKILITGIFSLVDKVRGYKEESVALRPRIFVTPFERLSEFKGLAATGNAVTLATGASDDQIFKKAMKLAAPLAINGWDIFIAINDSEYEFGVFSSGPRFHAVDPADQKFGFSLIVVRAINDSIVELINGNGEKLQLLFSAKKDEDFSFFKNIEHLVEGITNKLNATLEPTKKTRNLLKDVLTRSYSIEKGCLVAIVDKNAQVEALGFSDKLLLANPLDIYGFAAEFTQQKSVESYSKFLGLSDVIAGMLGSDGITLFNNEGKIIAYNCFVDFGVQKGRPIGGARSRAFHGLEQLKREQKIQGCFLLSQDGDSIWSA